ncbi:MAG: MotA/TolQ/ExbB proton channel family protein [Phycisphaerales bacterium]
MTLSDQLVNLLAQDGGESLFETIQKGGIVGYVIIGLSVVALVLVIVHMVQIRRAALLPPMQVDHVDQLLARGDVNGALGFCADPDQDSYFVRIMTVGLTRFQKSAFGAFEVKSAIEEAGQEQTARLYRSTDALGVIGSIAPLLGLLGTVLGMVGAFSTLSTSAAVKPEALAGDISLALVTTLMGLVLAIPCIALFTFFRNRIDAFASEAGREIERLLLHLESAGPGAPGRAAAPVPIRRPGPPPAAPRPASGPLPNR